VSHVVLDITFYEDAAPVWAEWAMWRESPPSGASEWISRGTAPSLEAAVDHALNAWLSVQAETEDSVPHKIGEGG